MENQNEQNPNHTPPISQVVQAPPVLNPINPPVLKPKSKLPVLIIGIILFLLVVGSAAGFYVFKQQSLKTAIKSTPSPIAQKQTPTPTANPDLIGANWNTYEVEEIGLTYKLPQNFPKLTKQNIDGQPGKQIYISASTGKVYVGPILLGTTSVDYSSARDGMFVDLQGYSKQNSNYLAKFVSGKTFEIPNELANEITNKNGTKILIVKGGNSNEPSLPISGTPGKGRIGALINTSSNVFPGFAVDMELNDKYTSELFDQILSTFKFTDSNITPTPDSAANWKTYTSNDGKFSFKYPQNLFLKENVKDYLVLTKTADAPGNLSEISIDARLNGIFSEYNSAIDNVKKSLTNISTKDFSNGIVIKGKMGPGMGEGIPTITGLIKYKTGAIAIQNSTNPLQEEILNQLLSTFKLTQ